MFNDPAFEEYSIARVLETGEHEAPRLPNGAILKNYWRLGSIFSDDEIYVEVS